MMQSGQTATAGKDEGCSPPRSRRLRPADQAAALALILHEEFGVAFTFYDAATGELLLASPAETGSRIFQPAEVRASCTGRAEVRPWSRGRFQLVLPLHQAGQVTLVATADLPALAYDPGDLAHEHARLRKWAQSVCDRLQFAESLQARTRVEQQAMEEVRAAWKVTLTLERLLRGLRAHRSSPRHLQRVLQAGFDLLDAESLFWVPKGADEPVAVFGQSCLAPADCRQLAVALAPQIERVSDGPFFCSRVAEAPWGKRHPQLHSLMAFAVGESGDSLFGWVIAVNKFSPSAAQETPGRPRREAALSMGFGRSDAAVLAPFVSLLSLQLRTSTRYHDLQELLVGLTRSLTSALDAKDPFTFGHSERVARIAVELAREMGLAPEELSDVYLVGLLHDVGNIGVNDAVLAKPGRLTEQEFEHVKQHVTIGYTILADLRQIGNLLPGVLYHHEHFDGTGYPDGLAGCAIPLVARILAVADGYDAMSTSRPYRPAIPCDRIEEILKEGAGKQWDPQVIEAFFRCRERIYATRQRGVGESLRHAIDGALAKGERSFVTQEVGVGNGEWGLGNGKSSILPRGPHGAPKE